MVKRKMIKSGGKVWRSVCIDPSTFDSADFEGLAGIEELTDYSVDSKCVLKKDQPEPKSDSSHEIKVKPLSKRDKLKSKKQKLESKKPKEKKKARKIKSKANSQALSHVGESSKSHDDEDDGGLISCMSAWNGLGVPSVLLRALAEKSFTAPTKIQALTLPPAIFGRRDILGAAETGSGKTLAFGLPILNGILQEIQAEKQVEPEKGPENVTESFEENSDVNENIKPNCYEEGIDEDLEEGSEVNYDENSDEGRENGSFSDEDQSSLIDSDGSLENFDGKAQCVKVIDDIDCDFPITKKEEKKSKYSLKPLYAVILTPTRELAIQISQHLKEAAKYTKISTAVVVGGLSSQKQERILNRGPEIVVGTPGRLWELIEQGHPHLVQIDSLRYLAIDETDRMLEKGHFEELQRILGRINKDETMKRKRQNFVFSATLTLTHEPPRYVLKKQSKKKGKKPVSARLTPAQKLASIMKTVGLTQPKVIDITESSGVASMLAEAHIVCPFEEKDFYLYYFLQRHPGRTLVFCNSIESVRRLAQLFTLLGCSPWPLHAKMHQKQRLKNLERFCSSPKSILLATDVAARGLDIPNVQHVIHYHIPRTAEGYVHRSGRTARAQQEGLTVLLVEPAEVSLFTRIFQTLGRDSNLPAFPVETEWMDLVKQRVNLARQLDKAELQARRINTEYGWYDKVVKEMDMEVSDDELPTSYSRKGGERVKKEAAALRKKLSTLLSKPLFPKGFSAKYPTQTGKLVVPLLPGSIPPTKESYHETAFDVLKHSVEDQKAAKRKMNCERSRMSKKRKRMREREEKESGDEEAETDN